MLLITAALVTSGCFVPPPLELEPDGGGSSAPEVKQQGTSPATGLPITVEQQSDPYRFNILLYDRDSSTLYVRAFIDGYPYTKPVDSKSVSGCTDEISNCSVSIGVVGLCDEQVNNGLGLHVIEFWVADQEWEDDPKDLRRTVAGGFTTSISWRFNCIESLKSDAGL